jgi:NTP pyrophosphatase (non-canonical NTP hydrolase)
MQFSDYQKASQKTAVYPGKGTIMGLAYTALGLGESGEVQGKVKKILRDDNSIISEEKRMEIGKELGDQLWYIAATATELGLNLDDIASLNIEKLQSRKERGTLQGSGDNR